MPKINKFTEIIKMFSATFLYLWGFGCIFLILNGFQISNFKEKPILSMFPSIFYLTQITFIHIGIVYLIFLDTPTKNTNTLLLINLAILLIFNTLFFLLAKPDGIGIVFWIFSAIYLQKSLLGLNVACFVLVLVSILTSPNYIPAVILSILFGFSIGTVARYIMHRLEVSRINRDI